MTAGFTGDSVRHGGMTCPSPTVGCLVLSLPYDVRSAPIARTALAHDLDVHHVLGDLRDDAQLVLSELVGNAVRHGRPLPGTDRIAARWDIEPGEVTVHVTDGGGGLPMEAHASEDAEGGRGLLIVDALADGWGVAHDAPGRTTVWARIVGA